MLICHSGAAGAHVSATTRYIATALCAMCSNSTITGCDRTLIHGCQRALLDACESDNTTGERGSKCISRPRVACTTCGLARGSCPCRATSASLLPGTHTPEHATGRPSRALRPESETTAWSFCSTTRPASATAASRRGCCAACGQQCHQSDELW